MKNPCIPENRVDFRLQLVAWIEANELAAKNSPQSADFSNGVAAGVRLALELFDKQGVPAFAELIEAVDSFLQEGHGRQGIRDALARVKGGAA